MTDRQCERCGEVNPAEIHTCTPQGPVAVWELQEGGWDTIADADWMETLPVGTKLYTAPPQREWVGLTHTELEDCILISEWATWIEVGRAIEQALKDKNT